MDSLTLIVFILAVVLTVAGFAAKRGRSAISGIAAVIGTVAVCKILTDPEIVGWDVSLTIIPMILIVGLDCIHAIKEVGE